jgi:hypothetical protein
MALIAGDPDCTTGFAADLFNQWTADSRAGLVTPLTDAARAATKALCWAIANQTASKVNDGLNGTDSSALAKYAADQAAAARDSVVLLTAEVALAQFNADQANAQLADYAADGVLSPFEKRAVIADAADLLGSRGAINDQLAVFIGTGDPALVVLRTSFDGALDGLDTYLQHLNPPLISGDSASEAAWIQVPTTIDGTLFRNTFAAAYAARLDVLTALSAKANSTAGNAAGVAQTAYDKAVLSAADAKTATDTLTLYASDNQLSPPEKRGVLKDLHDLLDNKAAIDAQATSFIGTGDTTGLQALKNTYDAKLSSTVGSGGLGDYMTSVTGLNLSSFTVEATWMTSTTPIDGPTFRTKFGDAYNARTALLNGIAAKAKSVADAAFNNAGTQAGQISGLQGTYTALNTAVTNAAGDATVARNAVISISSDGTLTPAEKSGVLLAYHDLIDNQSDIHNQAVSIGSDPTAYDTQINQLRSYFTTTIAAGGLGYTYDNLFLVPTDTTNPNTGNIALPAASGMTGAAYFNYRFNQAYTARQALLVAMARYARDLAQTANNGLDTGNPASVISQARTLAGSKASVYYTSTQPAGSSYNFGDMWFDTGTFVDAPATVGGATPTKTKYDLYVWSAPTVDSASNYWRLSTRTKLLVAGEIAAGAIVADKISAGTITADKLTIGGGSNILYNSDFSQGAPGGLSAWVGDIQVVSNGAVAVGCGLGTDPTWSLGGITDPYNTSSSNTYHVYQSNNPADDNAYEELVLPVSAVTQDLYYCASAYTGAHRCKVDLYISWQAAGGGWISNSYENYANRTSTAHNQRNVNNEDAAGGQQLVGYKRLFTVAKAPANACGARIILRKWNTRVGQADSWLFCCRAMFEECNAQTSVASPWAPAPSTIINGNSITADALVGKKIRTSPFIESGGVVLQGAILDGTLTNDSTPPIRVSAKGLKVGSSLMSETILNSQYTASGQVKVHPRSRSADIYNSLSLERAEFPNAPDYNVLRVYTGVLRNYSTISSASELYAAAFTQWCHDGVSRIGWPRQYGQGIVLSGADDGKAYVDLTIVDLYSAQKGWDWGYGGAAGDGWGTTDLTFNLLINIQINSGSGSFL